VQQKLALVPVQKQVVLVRLARLVQVLRVVEQLLAWLAHWVLVGGIGWQEMVLEQRGRG
jgi:hypothetical protein